MAVLLVQPPQRCLGHSGQPSWGTVGSPGSQTQGPEEQRSSRYNSIDKKQCRLGTIF